MSRHLGPRVRVRRAVGGALALTMLLTLPSGCASDAENESQKPAPTSARAFVAADFVSTQAAPQSAPDTPGASLSKPEGPSAARALPETTLSSKGKPTIAPPPMNPELLTAAPVAKSVPEAMNLSNMNKPGMESPGLSGSSGSSGSSSDVLVRAGSPPPVVATARAAEKPLVIDALIGQANGKPIYASEVLEPLDGKLRALGISSKRRDEWVRGASKEIAGELSRRIRDELILAEARSNLTTEQRTGLFQVLTQIQEGLVSSQRGSAVAADEALRREQGRTLQEAAKDRLDREIISNEVRTRVSPRVFVSWRDIQAEYERQFDKYNPPSIANLRLIVVSAPARSDDAAGMTAYAQNVSTINAALGGGKSFIEVASAIPNELRSNGGKAERKFSGSYVEGTFSPFASINDAIRALNVGQSSGPIVYKDDAGRERSTWVFLESIAQPPSETLYEAQLDVENELRDKRFDAEITKYLDTLIKRGNVSKMESMVSRLVDIASDRYWTGGAPGK